MLVAGAFFSELPVAGAFLSGVPVAGAFLSGVPVAGAFLVAEASSEAAVSANPRRYATTEPQRCYIVAVLIASMLHRCGYSPGQADHGLKLCWLLVTM
jgi:hypothetical protein